MGSSVISRRISSILTNTRNCMADDFIPDDEDEFSPEPEHTDPAMNFYVKGVHAYESGDRDRAKSMFEEAYRLNPGMKEAENAVGRFKETESSKNPQSIENYRQGYEQFLSGNYPSARSSWESAVAIDPTSYEAKKGLERLKMRGAM